MLRKLLIITCLFASTQISAQSSYEPYYNDKVKGPELPENVDKKSYKIPGDPFPPIKVVSLPWVERFLEAGSNGKNTEKTREVIPSKTITNRDLPADKQLVLMLFNPTCQHCEAQTELFEKNIGLFKNAQLLFVAAPMMGPYIVDYAKKYNLNEYPQIWMGLDSARLIEKTFLYYALPQINIYDKDKKLIRAFSGGAPIDTLRQYLQ
jgi:thiol-disulfide isomerase/thioredoxin